MDGILKRRRFDKTQYILGELFRESAIAGNLAGFRSRNIVVIGDNVQVLSTLMQEECAKIALEAKKQKIKPDYSCIKTIDGYGLGANELNISTRLYDAFKNAIYSSWETAEKQDYAHTAVFSTEVQRIYDIVPDLFEANYLATSFEKDMDYFAMPKMKIDLSIHNKTAPVHVENMDFNLGRDMEDDIYMVQSIINNAVKTEYRKTLLESIKGKHNEQEI